ncbi:DUF2169 family type VI secretion system accessory protein [Enhygromyxa salina]|uniref:DUF2169 family type VI secretion system accessory protein n=1 Tax=Enhygromyxa salina TaxID=215803 RepID=UPI0015E5C1F1|nr:DUF2169 domain-containing protein [Enhygromyxa salina]
MLGELGAFGLPSFDRHGRPLVVVFAAKTFVLPAAGRPAAGPLRAHVEQPLPPREDLHWGEPGVSSLRAEGMSAYTRLGTEIWASGDAWAPRGRAVESLALGLRVGPCTQAAVVTGERVWQQGAVGLRISKPAPFELLPVVYERAFGGTTASEACARNPVGRGLHASAAEAVGQLLPNIEAVDARVTGLASRPPPVGFGPIPRHWQPRVGWSGTYDQSWVETQAPLWPEDLDLRSFSAASEGLIAPGELRGGQPVVASGWSPDGDYRFELPSARMLARTTSRAGLVRQRMILDVVDLHFGEGTLMMIWRATIPVTPTDHESTSIRELEAWEVEP